MKKKHRPYTAIVRSCITGKVVWVYRGTPNGQRMAYWRACRKEVRRVRMWMQRVNERRREITRFINSCMAALPLTHEMTKEQREAARELQRIEKNEPPCHRDFYDHIMEETRRKNEASRRWRANRNKWLGRKN